MTLPKINAPEYSLVVPSTKVEVKYRPFLVKEEKLLLIAQETGDEKSLYGAIKNLIHNCCHGQLDVDTMPLFDVEYVFLQLRSKSVGEMAEVLVICPDDGETEVKVKVNLNELTVELPSKDHNKIKLTDDIGIVMAYPNLASVLLTADKNKNASDIMFDTILECMFQIWQGEEVFATTDYSHKEKLDFIDSLSHDQFEKIQQFFETMPTVKKEVEVMNPNTNVLSKVNIEGMNSFF